MIIKSNINTSYVKIAISDNIEKHFIIARAERFKSPATLTGHLTPYAHIITAVIMNTNAIKIKSVPITMHTFNGLPRNGTHTKYIDKILHRMNFGSERQPVNKNKIFVHC